jgi:hypothetical protein
MDSRARGVLFIVVGAVKHRPGEDFGFFLSFFVFADSGGAIGERGEFPTTNAMSRSAMSRKTLSLTTFWYIVSSRRLSGGKGSPLALHEHASLHRLGW